MNLNYTIISEILHDNDIHHFGCTRLTRPLSFNLYKEWISEGQHLDMNYLESHLPQKENPQVHLQAQSAIVFTIPYLPVQWTSQEAQLMNRTALYSKGKDYHNEIPKKLEPILKQLAMKFPNEKFNLYVDSGPVLERDLAYRAGLGWIGKNTCLIDRKAGSLFFIAEIYCTLDLENQNPWSADFCGQCNRCVDACPTQALTGNRKLLPSRCISYWTIESKSLPPVEIRSSMKDWLFGCDICQTVCPWNQKHLVKTIQAPSPSKIKIIEELQWILNTSRKTLARTFKETPLARAAGWKLQRNAIIVAVNNRYFELIPSIQLFEKDPKLEELTRWALRILSNP